MLFLLNSLPKLFEKWKQYWEGLPMSKKQKIIQIFRIAQTRRYGYYLDKAEYTQVICLNI